MGAFSSLMTVIAVLLQGLLVWTGKSRSRVPQVLLGDELERTATAAPPCMWPVSLCTQNSEQPVCRVKGFVKSPAPVFTLCTTGSQAPCICAHLCRLSS